MFQLIYLSGAVTDLQEAASWYEQQQAGRGINSCNASGKNWLTCSGMRQVIP